MYIAKLPLKEWYSAVNFQNSKLLRNHVQIVYWMKEKSFENLQLLVNHIQIVYRFKEKSFGNLQLLINHIQIVHWMKETSIWELTIVDKSHSLITLFEICVEIVYLMMEIILRICCTNNLCNFVCWQFLYVHLTVEEQILFHIGFQPKPQLIKLMDDIKLFATICHIWTLPIVTHPSLTIVPLDSKDMYKICDQSYLFI
jgi:hypothetical protein